MTHETPSPNREPKGTAPLAASLAAFEAGDFRAAFGTTAEALRDPTGVPLAVLHQLADLLEVSIQGLDPTEGEQVLRALLDETGGDLPPTVHVRVAALRFDVLRETHPDPAALADAALETLEAAASGADSAWRPLADPDRRAAILDLCKSPEVAGAALEQLAYAPRKAGMQAHVAGVVEALGFQFLTDPALVRQAEQALHQLGLPDAARRLEQARKQAAPLARRDGPKTQPPALSVRGKSVVVAGGHDRLRRAAAEALSGLGARDVRSIPPAWEGQLGGGTEPKVQGAHVVVLVVRQLDHSTSEAVKGYASGLGVACRTARSASVGAIVAAAADPVDGARA